MACAYIISIMRSGIVDKSRAIDIVIHRLLTWQRGKITRLAILLHYNITHNATFGAWFQDYPHFGASVADDADSIDGV